MLKPWLKIQWCLPMVGAEFVAAMGDVLELYGELYEAKRPKVNFDETSKQLIPRLTPAYRAYWFDPSQYAYKLSIENE